MVLIAVFITEKVSMRYFKSDQGGKIKSRPIVFDILMLTKKATLCIKRDYCSISNIVFATIAKLRRNTTVL